MPNETIAQLGTAATLTGTELVPVWQGGSPTLQTTLAAVLGLANVIPVPSGSTDTAITAAIASIVASGGPGIVTLQSGTYTFNNPVTLQSGVSIIGVPPSVQATAGGNWDSQQGWIPVGGTIIKAGTATQAFIGNITPQSTDTNFGRNWLSGIVLQNLLFSGFSGVASGSNTTGAVAIGAVQQEGCQFCNFNNLYFYQCGQFGSGAIYSNAIPALMLKNFGGISVSQIYISACPNGGFFYQSNQIDQCGNSRFDTLFCDTYNIVSTTNLTGNQVGTPAQFSRQWVFGTDPAYSASSSPGLNSLTVVNLQAQAVTRSNSAFSQTATFTTGGSSTQITLANVENYPVGMPIFFSAGNGATHANFTYFVLTNPGGTGAGAITYGNYRAAAAVASTGSGTATINQFGYPLLDCCPSVAAGGSGCVGSNFAKLDLEGVGICHYMESSVIYALYTVMSNNGIPSNTNLAPNIVVRGGGLTGDTVSAANVDFDTNSNILDGQLAYTVNFYLAQGRGRNQYTANLGAITQFLNIGGIGSAPTGATNSLPDFYLQNNGSGLRCATPLAICVNSISSAGALTNNGVSGGYWSFGQGTSQTYTMVASTYSSTNLEASTIGITYEGVNVGAGNAVVTPHAFSAGNYLNDNSGNTTGITLTTGQWFRAVLAYNAATSRTYWAVFTNGTIS